MGVRMLIGEYDGTKPAAVMVDSTSDTPVGPLWFGHDAPDQIEAFQAWLRRLTFMSIPTDVLGLEVHDVYDPARSDGIDPRAWPESGLRKLVAYWRREHLDEYGVLTQPTKEDQ